MCEELSAPSHGTSAGDSYRHHDFNYLRLKHSSTFESAAYIMKPIVFYFISLTFLSLTCKKASNFSLIKNKNQFIAIQPLNNYNTSGIETIQKEIASFYNRQVIILVPKKLPQHFLSKKTGLYSADSILKFLSGLKTNRIAEIVGLIDQPLFTIKKKAAFHILMKNYSAWAINPEMHVLFQTADFKQTTQIFITAD